MAAAGRRPAVRLHAKPIPGLTSPAERDDDTDHQFDPEVERVLCFDEASGRVFLFNHTGHLILARLQPKGYEELGRCLLVEPTAGYRAQGPITWAHPAYANQAVFARNDRELVCASLAATGAVETAVPPPAVLVRPLTYFEQNPALGLAFSPDGVRARRAHRD